MTNTSKEIPKPNTNMRFARIVSDDIAVVLQGHLVNFVIYVPMKGWT